jgi:hypothetical protein
MILRTTTAPKAIESTRTIPNPILNSFAMFGLLAELN